MQMIISLRLTLRITLSSLHQCNSIYAIPSRTKRVASPQDRHLWMRRPISRSLPQLNRTRNIKSTMETWRNKSWTTSLTTLLIGVRQAWNSPLLELLWQSIPPSTPELRQAYLAARSFHRTRNLNQWLTHQGPTRNIIITSLLPKTLCRVAIWVSK